MPSKDREYANKEFSSFLEKTCSPDLKSAKEFTSVPEEERASEEELALNLLKTKYVRGGGCPNFLFLSVSRELQKKYYIIHDEICDALYGPDSTTKNPPTIQ